MLKDEKSKRALSVRLPPDTMSAYSELIEGAALTISENVRGLIDEVLVKRQALDLSKMAVECVFKWRKPDPQYEFPEKIGTLHVNVTPPVGMSSDELSRLVFVIPEFFKGAREPFRIDSYYSHRVSNDRIWVRSTRVDRHILSFRLIQGKWSAGIFDYNHMADLKTLEEEIGTAVRSHISSTIICSMIGQLPPLRVLTQKELEHFDQVHPPTQPAEA